MKKSLVALATLAFAGVASAQSSVTLFGVLDVDASHYSQNSVSKTMLSSSGNTPSLLGFRGTEDLGGGLLANFWLEAALLNDSGAGTAGGGLAFTRRSTVSLAGNFGEIRLGRDYTPSFWNHAVFDPFGALGPGAGTNITLPYAPPNAVGLNGVTAARSSNAVQYLWGFAPNGGSAVGSGVYAQLEYGLPENVSGTPANGRYTGGRLGYANGPLNAAISYAQSQGKITTTGANNGVFTTFKEFSLGGSYNLGVAKLMALVGTNNSDVAGTRYTYWGLGTTITVGSGYIPVSFNSVKQNNATSAGANQFAIGYVYNLSKRTALYTSVSHITNKNNGTYTFLGGNGGGAPALSGNGLTSAGNGTGYDVGIRTTF